MTENRSRFVLLCQQALACAVVVAVAAPAAGIVDLDIVAPPAAGSGSAAGTTGGSLVASAPVAPTVREVPVDPAHAARVRSHETLTRSRAAQEDARTRSDVLVTEPADVDGFATVGVTWDNGRRFEDDEIAVTVRSLEGGEWSDWQVLPYDADHGPDPDSEEGRNARFGTDALIVGDVDDVQVKVVTEAGLPEDLRLSIVDPGETVAPTVQEPAIDTARLSSASTSGGTPAVPAATTTPSPTPTPDPSPSPSPSPSDPVDPEAELTGTPADVTPRPKIFSRAQWGAEERMRDKGSLWYNEVHAGFVHHTVNANGYTKEQVPSILRGIYAYHTQSRGWSDIGYNFLVDRFGRIWEGRYGGVDRPVVGAHTLNYNEYAFAMSAIGNFESAQPGDKMLTAYGKMFAWKLSLHGIDAGSKKQWVGRRWLPAINGHRDVGQTACPGKYLYAKIPTIRSRAVEAQRPFTSRTKDTDLSGSRWPDLVVRDKATKKAFIVRTGGQVGFTRPTPAAGGWGDVDLAAATFDVTGDGKPDVLARDGATKVTRIIPGDGAGKFGPVLRTTDRFAGLDLMAGAGDLDGDGRNDVVGRMADTKALVLFPGAAEASFAKSLRLAVDWSRFNSLSGAGDFDGDGDGDLFARDGDGKLWLAPGNGNGELGAPVLLPRKWGGYDVVTGMGDVTNDGIPDLVGRLRKSQDTYVYPGDGNGGFSTRFGPFAAFKGVDLLMAAGSVTGSKANDLVARNAAGRLVVFANRGGRSLDGTVATGSSFRNTNLILNVGDWNGDGYGDVITRRSTGGELLFRAGTGKNGFLAPVVAGKGFGSVNLLAAVGDITGDGYPDIMGQPSGGSMRIYPSNGGTGFRTSYVAHSAIGSSDQVGVGLWTTDGSPDSILKRSDGSLVLYPGNGPGGLTDGRQVGSGAGRYDWMQGAGDVDGDGREDIIARERENGKLWLLPGAGDGFDKRRFIAEGLDRFDLAG